MSRTKLIIWILIAACLVAGLFYFYSFGMSNQSTTSVRITRTSSGGITGKGDGKNITVDNSNLSADKLKEVQQKIDQAKIFSLHSEYLAPNCADAYTTELSVTLNSQAKTIKFANCGQTDLPSALTEFDTYVLTLK